MIIYTEYLVPNVDYSPIFLRCCHTLFICPYLVLIIWGSWVTAKFPVLAPVARSPKMVAIPKPHVDFWM